MCFMAVTKNIRNMYTLTSRGDLYRPKSGQRGKENCKGL